jgi:hypothetical protein
MGWEKDNECEEVRIRKKLVAAHFQVLFEHPPRETEEKHDIFQT